MAEWRTIALEEGLEQLIDYRGKSPPKSELGIPVISAKVVKGGRITRPIEQTIAPSFYPLWMTRGLPKVGDVVMTTEGPLGEIAQLDDETAGFALAQRVVCLRGKRGVLYNGFLKFLLMSPVQQDILSSFGTGTTVQGISQKALRQVPISVPPYVEQVGIGSLLAALDDKIDLNRRMNKTLEAMAQAIFKDWFVDFGPTRAKMEGCPPYLSPEIWSLFPSGLDEKGKPENWEIRTIGDEVAVLGGSTPSTADSSFWDGDICWTTPKDLSNLHSPVLLESERRISKAGLEQIASGQLPVGTVLLSSRAPIGYLAITEVPTAVNQGFIALVCRQRISNVFAWLWCRFNMDIILQHANGSTFQEISKRNFRPLPVIVPVQAILRGFDDLVKPLHLRIVANERENRTLAQTRDLLLPKLMSGEMRIKEADKAMAELV